MRHPSGQKVLFVTDFKLHRADLSRPYEREETAHIRAQSNSGIYSNRLVDTRRVITGVLQCFPHTLQEKAMLRVHQRGIARIESECTRIEKLNPLDNAPRPHVPR